MSNENHNDFKTNNAAENTSEPTSKDNSSFISWLRSRFHSLGNVQTESTETNYVCPENTFTEAAKLYKKLCNDHKIETLSDNDCDICNNITLFFTNRFGHNDIGVDILKSDRIWIKPINIGDIETNFFMIISISSNEPIVCGNFIKDDNRYYLTAHSKNIKLDFSSTNTNYKIIFAKKDFSGFYSKNLRIFVEPLPIADEILCIDFGTSNTTAGTWERTIEEIVTKLVRFDDVTKPDTESNFDLTKTEKDGIYFLPTIAYLKDFHSEDNKYLFGYDAKKQIFENNYNPKGNIFYNIKQWILAEDDYQIKGILDENGEKGEINAKDIIIEYIKYVIEKAEIYLKKKYTTLHFSAPVKCKDTFINFVASKLKPEYLVLSAKESLDEAIAIIYNRITKFRLNYEQDENGAKEMGELMVIDCGGGTTDAASCSYRFTKAKAGTKISITTKFENGQTAFGGNDLTYRIFQFLKIRLCDYYRGENNKDTTEQILKSLKTFKIIKKDNRTDTATMKMEQMDEDFFTHIDTCIETSERFDCYDELDRRSNEVENFIPTDFGNDNLIDSKSKKEMARRNFNYLWQLAEQWKIKLYSSNSTYNVDFNTDLQTHSSVNSSIPYIYFDEGDYESELGIKQKELNELQQKEQTEEIKNSIKDIQEKISDIEEKIENIKEKLNRKPEISLYREELIALLKPQIYYLLSIMFLKADGTRRDDDEMPQSLHLSGQSCTMEFFQDMLKEFVPGRRLRGATKIESAYKKKLACVEGCIQYLMDKEYGEVFADIKMGMPNIIYTVKVDRGSKDKEETLLEGGKIHENAGKIYMPNIPIHRRWYSNGKIYISVYNNLIKSDIPNNQNSIPIQTDFSKGKDIENKDELRNTLMKNAPENFDQYYCKIMGDEIHILDRLIEQLEEEEDLDQVLVFAIPNKDNFSFTLWQLLKHNQTPNGKTVFHIMRADSLRYEKVEFTTRFDGKNCYSLN